jgi:transposase-like protein
MVEGKSVRKAAELCGVHRNTTFRWRHRFLSLVETEKPERLTGIVEADETFFRESFKGQKRGMARPARKRGTKAKKRGTSEEYKPVLIIRDRSGSTREEILRSTRTEEIARALKPVVSRDAILCADGGAAYRLFAEAEGITLKAVNLSAGIRVVERVFHIQNVNAYHSRLKNWMRRFHGVATRHLSIYLGWRRLIEREVRILSPQTLILAAQGANN